MKLFLLATAVIGYWLERAAGVKISPYEGLSISNLCIYAMVVIIVLRAKDIQLRLGAIDAALFALILWYFCSIPIKLMNPEFESIGFYDELRSYKSWITPFFFYFLFSRLIDNEKAARRVILVLLLVAVASAVAGLLSAKGYSFLAKAGTNVEGRAFAFAEPNQFAAYLVIMAPLLITSMLFGKTIFNKFSSAVGFICIVGAIVATGSRGGLIALVAAILVYVALGVAYRAITPVMGVVVTIVITITLTLGVLLAPRVVSELTMRKFEFKKSGNMSEFTSGRTMLMENGLELIRERPLFGHGQESFLPLMVKRFKVRALSHNEFLGYAVEQGIVGLVLLLTVYVIVIVNALHCLRFSLSSESRGLYIAFIGGFIGLCVALFAVNLFGPRTLIWMYVAAIIAHVRATKETSKEDSNEFTVCFPLKNEGPGSELGDLQ